MIYIYIYIGMNTTLGSTHGLGRAAAQERTPGRRRRNARRSASRATARPPPSYRRRRGRRRAIPHRGTGRGHPGVDLRAAKPRRPPAPPNRPPPCDPVPLLRPRRRLLPNLLHRRPRLHPPGQRLPARCRPVPDPHPVPALQPLLDLRRRGRLRLVRPAGWSPVSGPMIHTVFPLILTFPYVYAV